MIPKLRTRFNLAVLILLIAVLALPSLVSAGGWAVITLDQLPVGVTAEQPYDIGFMARQHGRSPWLVKEIRIEAKQVQTGRTATFIATPDGKPGHYRAELVFPDAGSWEWGIESGLFPDLQPMPVLQVAGTLPAASVGSGLLSIMEVPVALLGTITALAFAAGIVLIVRNPDKKLLRLAGGGLIIVCVGLVAAFFSSANAQAGQVQMAPEVATVRDTGQQLFLAKGCVVCHTNERALKNSAEYGVNVGPNLTVYRNDPNYLHALLKDPAEIKNESNTEFDMPDLGLKLVEIEALISFINEPSSD